VSAGSSLRKTHTNHARRLAEYFNSQFGRRPQIELSPGSRSPARFFGANRRLNPSGINNDLDSAGTSPRSHAGLFTSDLLTWQERSFTEKMEEMDCGDYVVSRSTS